MPETRDTLKPSNPQTLKPSNPIISCLNNFFARLLNPRGRKSFLKSLPSHEKVLDVGCGNNSPQIVKSVRPDVYYVGT